MADQVLKQTNQGWNRHCKSVSLMLMAWAEKVHSTKDYSALVRADCQVQYARDERAHASPMYRKP